MTSTFSIIRAPVPGGYRARKGYSNALPSRVSPSASIRPPRYKDEVFVTVTTTKGSPEQPLDVATLAGEEMLPWLRDIDGFEGLLMLSSETDGTTLVLTFWQSREIAEEHRVARARFRDQITSAVDVRVVGAADYELTFADLGSWPPTSAG
jgi:heme-degrading monooxygenase HmoA